MIEIIITPDPSEPRRNWVGMTNTELRRDHRIERMLIKQLLVVAGLLARQLARLGRRRGVRLIVR